MTRRSLIHGLLLTLGIDVVGVGPPAGRPLRVFAAQPAPPAGTGPAAAVLSGPELDDLLAFAEIVVVGDPLAPQGRRHVADHIEYRAKQASGYYLALYRTTASLLGRLGGRPFARLDIAERKALVARYRLSTSSIGPDEDVGPFPHDARAVRTGVVPDLIRGYYGSPAGWAVVHYDGFPGQCSDLTRYTRPLVSPQ